MSEERLERPGQGWISYQVKPGDTLWAIGKRFGVPWTRIARDNQMANPDKIWPGDVLRLPEP